MTLKVSRDHGMIWPESDARPYDSRSCYGYSCPCEAGPDYVGVLDEGKDSILYLSFLLDE